MNPPTFLATKFHTPALHPRRVERARLVQRLDEGLAAGRALTLISAPAGFGKSTCASEWLSALTIPHAWLSLETIDNDPGRFFAYFIAAMQKINENIGQEIAGVLQTGQLPSLELLSAVLVNDILQAGQPFVLALDDFQNIQERSILDVLERLLANPPPQMHLLLITREDPLLPLARLRANNQMTEIRAGDLRFRAGEVETFLRETLALPLSEEDIAELEHRTEGWAAGLQLAGLSIRGRSDVSQFIQSINGSQRYFLRYLTEEVLQRQPEEIQQFLMQTSILDSLSGPLCDAVTGRAGSSLLLERLYAANLFLIPLDDDQQWYRYHHLFADLLRSHQARMDRETLSDLHRRACRWYSQAEIPGEAIFHGLAGEDYPAVVRLLEQHALGMVMQGYVKTVDGWMQSLPNNWQTHNPRANLAFAWMYLLRGSYASVNLYLERAQAGIARADGEDTSALRAEWMALQSSLMSAQGRTTEGLELAEQALQAASPSDFYVLSLALTGLGSAYRQAGQYEASVEAYQRAIQASRASGNAVCEMLATAHLTLMALQHGQLRLAAESATQTVERLERGGAAPPPVAGSVYGALGQVYLEWNQVNRALALFNRSMELSYLGGHNAALIYNHVTLSRLYQSQGNLEAAAEALQEALDLLPFGAPSWLIPEVASQQVRVHLAQGSDLLAEIALQPFGLPAWQAPASPTEPAKAGFSHAAALLAVANLRLLWSRARSAALPPDERQEQLRSCANLASELIAACVAGRRVGSAIQALLLRAQILAALNQQGAAQADAAHALALSAPERHLRIILDEGPEAAALIHQVLPALPAGQKVWAEEVLAAFPPGNLPPQAAALRQEDWYEPLTGRELEVLRLIAGGMKYEEVAQNLVISVNTVRFYVKEIYSKLNVNNRTRAVETARQLGLL